MFKAISRWGSQVRSSLGLGFISNMFGSKSRSKYGAMGDDTEEIFSDTHEEPFSDYEDDHKVVIETLEITKASDVTVKDQSDSKSNEKDLAEQKNENSVTGTTADSRKPENSLIDIDFTDSVLVEDGEHDDQSSNKPDASAKDVMFECSSHKSEDSDSVDTDNESNHSVGDSNDKNEKRVDDKKIVDSVDVNNEKCDNDSNKDNVVDNNDDHDHHSIHHDDKTQIVKSGSNKDSKQNGMPHSSSSGSIFQKVHRRMNSYSQRQYAKFDNLHDDENDNVIIPDKTDTVDSKCETLTVDNKDVDEVTDFKEKKHKKKKKVALFSFIRGIFRRTNK